MDSTPAFTVYNASAGAGKTYTLVKSYVKTLLSGQYKDSYKNILAITFTNKAVIEMKTRVLDSLVGLSQEETPSRYQDLLEDLVVEMTCSPNEIHKKASSALKSILHNYAGFDIVTIDTFTHRVIRTFAKDLEIPMNFDIEMDVENLLEEAVDMVMAKVGLDPELTKIVVDFAISKLDDDKSWDITLELNKVAKILYHENDRSHLAKLLNKTPADFKSLKKIIRTKVEHANSKIEEEARKILKKIEDNGIEYADFTRGSIPAHFKKLASGNTVDYKASWKNNIETTTFYNAKTEGHIKDKIDTLRPEIEQVFLETKALFLEVVFLQNILKNLVPLSVLTEIHKALHDLKKEKGVLLISEFNKIISEAIRNEPAPFIYERLGERYRDYFIDEFQDTSELQWNNIIPLIDSALSTETLTGQRGHLTIVGDAKQAIYRWRGGKAEQFIDLSLDKNPFSINEKKVINLPRNYRSCKEIIKFNNSFFTFLSKDFRSPIHRELYKIGNQQAYNSKEGGRVNISFIQAKTVEDENEIYPKRVYEIIGELIEKGYQLKDICVITRKQKEGNSIAGFLSEQGIPIISSETLLLKNNSDVTFLVDLLTWHTNPDHLIAKTRMLYFIGRRLSIPDMHAFLDELTFANSVEIGKALNLLGISVDFIGLTVKPLYDVVEYCIGAFGLADAGSAYLQFFLDTIFSYAQKNSDGILGFLSYWELKKDNISIVAPEGEDAVMMMTIHKSKGLEFPCVIYPYVNTHIYNEIEPKTWMPVAPEQYAAFDEVYLSYNKELAQLGNKEKMIVEERQSQLELDAFNLLYVALTRAKEQLFLVSRLELTSKGESNPNKFSGKLINFLRQENLWKEGEHTYTFGRASKPQQTESKTDAEVKKMHLASFNSGDQKYKVQIVTNSGKLWNTAQGNAIEKGNLVHELMASVFTKEDIDQVVEKASQSGQITIFEKEGIYQEMLKVIQHPKIAKYFAKGNVILNERDIYCYGAVYRPDRVIFNKENQVSLIDYKTGKFKTLHANQLQKYSEIIQKMGYNVGEKILIYFGEEIYLKYV